MRCDVVIDAVGRAGERYEVQDVFYPREQFVLMDLAYGTAPRLADTFPPVTTLTGNLVPEPDLPSASTHEILFGGGMMGNLHQAMLDGQPVDMRGCSGEARHGPSTDTSRTPTSCTRCSA